MQIYFSNFSSQDAVIGLFFIVFSHLGKNFAPKVDRLRILPAVNLLKGKKFVRRAEREKQNLRVQKVPSIDFMLFLLDPLQQRGHLVESSACILDLYQDDETADGQNSIKIIPFYAY